MGSAKHLLQKLMQSKVWLLYCACQLAASGFILSQVGAAHPDLQRPETEVARTNPSNRGSAFVLEFTMTFLVVFDIALKYVVFGRVVQVDAGNLAIFLVSSGRCAASYHDLHCILDGC